MASFASSATMGGARKHAWTKKRANDGNNNGHLRIANATSGGARKATWPIIRSPDPSKPLKDLKIDEV